MRKLSLWLLIFLLPTQIGLHLWPGFSYVSGFKIDYLSPVIYITDLAILLFILLFYPKHSIKKYSKYLTYFFFFVLVNTIFSIRPLLSLFFWGRCYLYLLFFFSLLQTAKLKDKIRLPLSISTAVIIFLQFLQLYSQKSIGGIFYYLGERAINLSTPNVAKLSLGNLGLFLRPYSIFSHPNSLAGYLLLTLIILKWCKTVPNLRRSAAIAKDGSATFGGLQPLTEIFISLAIILTFSKMAILTLVLLQIKNQKSIKKITFLAILVGLLPLLVNFTNLKYTPGNSFLTRAFMGYSTQKIILNNYIFGAGLRGFIPALAKYLSPSQINRSTLQPVHSLPLLITSELGIVGLILIYHLIKEFNASPLGNRLKANSKIFNQTIMVIALTGAVDHYWWTLPQNQLILILALALSFVSHSKSNSHPPPKLTNPLPRSLH